VVDGPPPTLTGEASASGVWRDPTWRRATPLSELEGALLERPELRRLDGLHHHGPAGRLLGWTTTRLEHTLGVWTITAALRPDDATLRLAALLHDVGHAPYSHALEPLGGIDHHAAFGAALDSGALGSWLRGRGVDVERVVALVEGREPSPVRNRDGWLHADHLDSFVRGAAWRGRVRVDPGEVLQGLRLDGPHLAFDARHADDLLAAVLDEARFQLGPIDVGADACLIEAVGRSVALGVLDRDELPSLRDAELDERLRAQADTRGTFADLLAGRLRFVAAPDAASARWCVAKRAGYLPRPRFVVPAPDGWERRLATAYGPFAEERVVCVALASTACSPDPNGRTPPGRSGGRRLPVVE